MVAGYGIIEPQTVANNISLRNILEMFCSSDVDISACYKCLQGCRSLLHNALIERELKREKIL